MAAKSSAPVTIRVIEAAPMLEMLDPARITVKNVRTAQPDKEFIESVRELGNIQPIGVLRAPDGELVLQFGLQRLQACIETGRKVLAMTVDGTAGTSEAEIERIFLQLAENDRRKDLTAADRAGAVAELFEYGADERTVTRRTGYGKAEIAAARKAHASETARTLAAQYPLTLDQAAVIAEFDDDTEAAEELARVARDEPGQFEHVAEQAREDRTEAAMVAARTAELTAQGITVASGYLPYDKRIEYWNGADGRQLTPESHKDCPGAVVLLRISGDGENRRAEETCYCTDPKGNGHKQRRGLSSGPDKSPEEASAERRRVIEGNKAWRAAAAVRRRWLRDVLLARKTVPDGAAVFIARAVAAADHHLINTISTMSGGRHPVARELLGITGKDTWNGTTREYDSPLVDSLAGISEQRAQVITLALVIGSYEGQTADPQTWRSPSRPPREYLTALAGWGYTLSLIEQQVVEAAGGSRAEQPAPTPGEEDDGVH